MSCECPFNLIMLLLEVGYCTPASKAKGGWKRDRERVFPILNRINAGEGHWEKDVASTRSLPLIQFRQRLFVHLYLCVCGRVFVCDHWKPPLPRPHWHMLLIMHYAAESRPGWSRVSRLPNPEVQALCWRLYQADRKRTFVNYSNTTTIMR